MARRKRLGEMPAADACETARRAGRAAKAILPPGTLYSLLVFESADAGCVYVSNADSAETVAVLRECADRIEEKSAHTDRPGEGGPR